MTWYIDPSRPPSIPPDSTRRVIEKYLESNLKLSQHSDSGDRIIDRFAETGRDMIHEINSRNPSLVVDLACGFNAYRDHIQNLVGLDITPAARVDIVSDFTSTPLRSMVADVILCLNGFAFKKENRAVFQEIKRIAVPGAWIYCRVAEKVLKKQGLGVKSTINGIAEEFGFRFRQPLRPCHFTDPADQGVYFSGGDPAHLSTWRRRRWTWCWTV